MQYETYGNYFSEADIGAKYVVTCVVLLELSKFVGNLCWPFPVAVPNRIEFEFIQSRLIC